MPRFGGALHSYRGALAIGVALPEAAGTGFIDRIQLTVPPAAVPTPIAGAGLPGMISERRICWLHL